MFATLLQADEAAVPPELDLKLTEGTDALLDAFDRARVTELLDPDRPSAV